MSVQGKIIKSIAGFYDVYAEDTLYRCRAKGVFRSLGEKPLVGDDVLIDVTDTVSDPKEGNVLIRPNVANVDQALLLFAITNPAPSYNMLDRFLILMKQKRLPAILCFNKLDLATAEQLAELKSVYEKCGCRVMFIQTTDEESLSPLIVALSGKTTVITGPSGAGKSSLINRLCPAAHMQTGELSRKISRGKNTTRHTELLAAGGGTYLVDTPGFTSLDLPGLTADDLKDYYPEFTEEAAGCRFQGCSHIAEPGCRVKEAVREGRISSIRYNNYLEIYGQLKQQRPVYSKKTRG